jgi:AraC-like DNA-binding protein
MLAPLARPEKLPPVAKLFRRSDGAWDMTEGGTFTFNDPDSYAAAFGDACVNLTITGAGDFKARLTWLKLHHLEVYRYRESLPRIAYISLLPERVFMSFPVSTASLRCGGFGLRNGDIVLHSTGERVHQRSSGECHWGLISLPHEQLASCGKALIGTPIASPPASRILRPSRAETSRFQALFGQACHLAETRKELIELPEIARALEQEMLHAIIHCLAAKDADDHPRARHHHAAIMVRFEETLRKRIDQKLSMPTLCAELGVAERTLRMCCAEFLGVSPTRYVLLQRLNKARSALRRADPSTASVAQVARNHQFLELGRFAVTYRATFGESPSVTLQRDPRP